MRRPDRPGTGKPKSEPPRPAATREACLAEAARIIEERGLEALSLREVSRCLGLSHQAPYKHFASRDHLLAAVVARAYAAFARHLEARPAQAEPFADLEAMGRAYIDYAMRHPLQYRLMFGTPLPDPAQHPQMMREAQHAFALLRDRLAGMRLRETGGPADPTGDALFIWATLHGLAGILRADALQAAAPGVQAEQVMSHAMRRLDLAIRPPEAG